MSNPTRPPLKPLQQAWEELLAYAVPLAAPELVPTHEADGRVLAESIRAELQVPPQDNSAMDGYAVRSADIAQAGIALPVSQRIAAGDNGQPLAAGTVARIFTGAPIPPGADAVVMQEDTAAQPDGAVAFNAVPTAGQNVRRAGEDITRGAEILAAGTRLTPAELGQAASVGRAQLLVARRPRVALLSTGDELIMPGEVAPQDMRPGSIYNSNRFFLRSLLVRLGCEVHDMGNVPDSREATVAALREAGASFDLVLTSGGVSVGEEDHIKPAVQLLGQLHLWQLAIKPGKPFAYGTVGQAHFIGLPGNPVSSFVTFLLLVRPFVLRLQGLSQLEPPRVAMRADFDWARPDKRQEFLRVRRNANDGLDLYPNQSSGVLTSVVWGDGLIDNPGGGTIRRGDTVRFIPFAELLV
ncbi:molybdopterin molybdotransferase MoeA [Comamonas humi]